MGVDYCVCTTLNVVPIADTRKPMDQLVPINARDDHC